MLSYIISIPLYIIVFLIYSRTREISAETVWDHDTYKCKRIETDRPLPLPLLSLIVAVACYCIPVLNAILGISALIVTTVIISSDSELKFDLPKWLTKDIREYGKKSGTSEEISS